MLYSNTIGYISGHNTDMMIITNIFPKYSIFLKICRWIDKWWGADLVPSPIEWTKWCFETSSCYSSNDWKTLKTYFNFDNHTNVEKNVCLWVKTRSTLAKCYFIALLLFFGHRTNTNIPFISINQSCHIKHNAAVKLANSCIETYFKAEEELQEGIFDAGSWFPDHDKKHKCHITKLPQ